MRKATIIMFALIIALSFAIVGCSSGQSGNGYTNTAPTGNVVASGGQDQSAASTVSGAQVTIQNTTASTTTAVPDAYTNIQSASDDFNNIDVALNYT
jgi:uncharacterized protein YcfL